MMVHALSQLLPTSIVTATAWWQLTVLVSVAEKLLKTSAAYAVVLASLTVLVTATATFLTIAVNAAATEAHVLSRM